MLISIPAAIRSGCATSYISEKFCVHVSDTARQAKIDVHDENAGDKRRRHRAVIEMPSLHTDDGINEMMIEQRESETREIWPYKGLVRSSRSYAKVQLPRLKSFLNQRCA